MGKKIDEPGSDELLGDKLRDEREVAEEQIKAKAREEEKVAARAYSEEDEK